MTLALARAKRRRRLASWAVAALAALAFLAALLGTYVFDDIHSVSANPALRDGASWWRWLSDPTAFSTVGKMFRPVVLTSLGLQFLVSDAAGWFKFGNMALHALVAALAFGWLRRFGLGTGAAFAVTALFAVHPLTSEAVNLISARSELLLYTGILIALRAHLAHCRGGAALPAQLGIVFGVAIACGSKETGVVLPGLLLAQAFLIRREPWRAVDWGRAVRTVLPAVALVVVYLLLRKVLLGEAVVQLAGRTGADPLSGHGRSLVCQLATMGLLLPQSLVQMVLPVGLSLDPLPTFRHSFADPWVLLGWGSTLGLLGLGLMPGPNASVRRFGVVLTVATALPWVIIPLNVPLAEHRLYGPLLGMLMVAAPWLPRPGGIMRSRLARRSAPRFAARPPARPLALVGLLLLGIVLANARSLDYRDEVRLWQAELERADTWRAWWGLGAAQLRAGDRLAAVEPLTKAWRRNGGHATVVRNLTEALVRVPDEHARPARSLAAAAAYVEARPNDPWARTLLAEANLQKGRIDADREAFATAERTALSCLEIAPPKGYVYWLAARARRGLGDEEAALAHLDTSIDQGLDYVTVRLERAAVLRALGRDRAAQAELLRAQRQAPMNPAVLQALRAATPPR